LIIHMNLIITACLACSTICWLLIMTRKWHQRWSDDGVLGVQKSHSIATPRIGGMGIFSGLMVCVLTTNGEVFSIAFTMLIAGAPAFVAGLLEDFTKRVGVTERLIATMLGGLIAWAHTGISLTRLDIWGWDTWLMWSWFSVLFTAFAIAGVVNALNIIDGLNGLASGVFVLCCAGLGCVAYLVGDYHLAQLSLMLVAVALGFMVWNFPFGKIFLGDGGAYLLGFCLAWLAVLLPMRNQGVSPWVSLLICSYPIIEVLFSMWRRWRRHNPTGQPDRLHLHSLIWARWSRKRLAAYSLTLRNSAVAPWIWAGILMPIGLAIMFFDADSKFLMGCFALVTGVYFLIYRRLIKFAWLR
jgi:UDP-N-acetylmuramyl pentapeptide phosphotransferase/UDP-N-acetylglucosamine-1-phosphate transferase